MVSLTYALKRATDEGKGYARHRQKSTTPTPNMRSTQPSVLAD